MCGVCVRGARLFWAVAMLFFLRVVLVWVLGFVRCWGGVFGGLLSCPPVVY